MLVATLPERGHLNPFHGPAAALQERGAEVAFFVAKDVRAELLDAGFPNVFVPKGEGPPSTEHRGEEFAAILRDRPMLASWIRKLLADDVEAVIPSVAAAIDEFAPHVVALDPMFYGAAIAAHRAGIPWVGWSTSLNPVVPTAWRSDLIETTNALPRTELFERHGMQVSFRVSDVLSPYGTAVFATEALVGRAPPGVCLVGPSLPRRPRTKGPTVGWPTEGREGSLGPSARPLVYVSFGSQAWHQPARYAKLFASVEALDLDLCVAAGDLAATLQPPRGLGRIEIVRYADQLAVLSRARAIVTHGGANSVMESLSHGVPLLLSPLCNDQPHNAWFVEKAGAGVALDLETASVDTVRAAISRLVGECEERTSARAIATSYGSRDGAGGAADLALAAARRPT